MTNTFAAFLFIVAFTVAAAAQSMPPGASDSNLEDRNIKGRSVELERARRELYKGGNKQNEELERLRFTQIKEDFERIQMLQTVNIEVYTKSKMIDYSLVAKNAADMSKSGTRLHDNLFPVIPEDPKEKKKKKKTDEPAPEPPAERPVPTTVRDLIVEMDNTLGAFTSNQMFTNPTVINAKENARAKADLEHLIKLANALNTVALSQAK